MKDLEKLIDEAVNQILDAKCALDRGRETFDYYDMVYKAAVRDIVGSARDARPVRTPVGVAMVTEHGETYPLVVCDDGTAWFTNEGEWEVDATGPIPGTRADKEANNGE